LLIFFFVMNNRPKTINSIPLELWDSILLWAILGINNLSDLSLVSKQFRCIFFTEKWMSKIAHRNMCSSLKQFLPFIEHNEDCFQDYVISRTITLLSQYNYCFSGAFTLAVILGANIGKLGWNLTTVDIYISMSKQDYSRQQFSESVHEWWEEVNAYFNCTMANLKFCTTTKIKEWIPTITQNHHMMVLITLQIFGHDDDDSRVFRLFILNSRFHNKPAIFCGSKSEFTFLCNSITVDKCGAYKTQVNFPTAVITKTGPYSRWYLSEWELEWRLWITQQCHTNKKVRKYHIKRRKLIPSVEEKRLVYISRGFVISSFIPRKNFF